MECEGGVFLREVLDRGNPLPLSMQAALLKSPRGLPQSGTLARLRKRHLTIYSSTDLTDLTI